MLEINNLQLVTLMSSFFWPMVRILSFFSIAPILGDKIVSKKNKIVLSCMISFLLFPFLPRVNTELFSFFGFLLLFQQILIGIVLGFTAQFLFVTAKFSGEIIGLQMGLSFATFFNNNSQIGISIISRLFNILALFLFLVFNTHLYLISMLVDSFYSMPIDNYTLNVDIFFALLKFSSNIFFSSILFILPIMIILLTISFIMSILNRLSPQISIFSIGFPLNLLISILVLYFSMSTTLPFFEKSLNDWMFFMSSVFL